MTHHRERAVVHQRCMQQPRQWPRNGAVAPLQLRLLSARGIIRVWTSSFLRGARRATSEGLSRSRKGALRTWSRLNIHHKAHISFDLHDLESLSSRLCVASRPPRAGCRQSIRRRRRPLICSRCCRVPQPWPADAKSASKKLSPSTTTGPETPV